jgi:hypothetical protein
MMHNFFPSPQPSPADRYFLRTEIALREREKRRELQVKMMHNFFPSPQPSPADRYFLRTKIALREREKREKVKSADLQWERKQFSSPSPTTDGFDREKIYQWERAGVRGKK